MRIHIWIKADIIERIAKFLSDEVYNDDELTIKHGDWYSSQGMLPACGESDLYVEVSITPDQYFLILSLMKPLDTLKV